MAFADRDVARGQRVAAEIAASGGHVVFVETHVEQEAEVAAFMQSAVDHFGQLNILVNNAGIRMYHTVVEASAESWHTIHMVLSQSSIFGQNPKIGCQKFNDVQSPKRSKKQLCDRTGLADQQL